MTSNSFDFNRNNISVIATGLATNFGGDCQGQS